MDFNFYCTLKILTVPVSSKRSSLNLALIAAEGVICVLFLTMVRINHSKVVVFVIVGQNFMHVSTIVYTWLNFQ